MREITVNCENLDKAGLHRALQDALGFPEWYGGNLDALYDCLTEICENTHLILENPPALPGFGDALWDAVRDNPRFSCTLR